MRLLAVHIIYCFSDCFIFIFHSIWQTKYIKKKQIAGSQISARLLSLYVINWHCVAFSAFPRVDVPTLTLKIELPLWNYISWPLIRIDPDKMLVTNIGKFAISACFRFSRWGFYEVGRELAIKGRSVLLGNTKVYQNKYFREILVWTTLAVTL